MAKVSSLNFGSIVIDGKQYAYGVVVLPDGIVREREANKAMFGGRLALSCLMSRSANNQRERCS